MSKCTIFMTLLCTSVAIASGGRSLSSENEHAAYIPMEELIMSGATMNNDDSTIPNIPLSAVFRAATQVGDSVKDSESLAVQTSIAGGSIYTQDSVHYLALHGVLKQTMTFENPSDPSTTRLIKHGAVAEILPRFALLMTNASKTDEPNPTIHTMSLNLLSLVESQSGSDTLIYKVEIMDTDIQEQSGPASVDFTKSFDKGMLMIDVANADADESKSLKKYTEQHAKPTNEMEVKAQGAVFSWYLGPFMYACCPYGLLTLPFVALNPLSLPWVFSYCCI